VLIQLIERIPSNMRASINNFNLMACIGKLPCANAPSEACANNQKLFHLIVYYYLKRA